MYDGRETAEKILIRSDEGVEEDLLGFVKSESANLGSESRGYRYCCCADWLLCYLSGMDMDIDSPAESNSLPPRYRIVQVHFLFSLLSFTLQNHPFFLIFFFYEIGKLLLELAFIQRGWCSILGFQQVLDRNLVSEYGCRSPTQDCEI